MKKPTRQSPLPALLSAAAVAGIVLAFWHLQAPGRPSALDLPDITAAPAAAVSVSSSGAFQIVFPAAGFTFAGALGQRPSGITTSRGTDGIGAYQQTSFSYRASGRRAASIRAYIGQPSVLFLTRYDDAAPNRQPFPDFSTYPQTPYHLSYDNLFAEQRFDLQGGGGPLVFFDDNATTAILSPASHFVIARSQEAGGRLSSGIDPAIARLPAGYTQATILTAGKGINATFAAWGHNLTALQGKTRPSNQADVLLKYLSYWTDSGAAYYYRYDQAAGSYPATLLAIKQEYAKKGVPIKSMQLDSWWYGPKGSDLGIVSYTADPAVWPAAGGATAGSGSLGAFRQALGLPTIVHSRWISPASPYRARYTVSGGVATGFDYWHAIISYAKQTAGAIVFEQDWMDVKAKTLLNLTDPEAFMDNMAAAAKSAGLALQYCMELPSQILQGSNYSNLLTMRVSIDRFGQNRWEPALWASQLAKSLGTWPWVDVFMSDETDNVLLADLSAGPVGPGDALGTVNAHNLRQAIRGDSVIVKPDEPLVPTDAAYINDAKGNTRSPLVASTYTDFGNGQQAVYAIAFPRPYHTTETVSFQPADFSFSGPAYIYNYFDGQGKLMAPGSRFSDSISQLAYYIIVPVGPSGIGFLGDQDKFVSLGKERVSSLSDNGTLNATLSFAPDESSVTVHGYAKSAPLISASEGSLTTQTYDPASQLFSAHIKASAGHRAVLHLRLRNMPEKSGDFPTIP